MTPTPAQQGAEPAAWLHDDPSGHRNTCDAGRCDVRLFREGAVMGAHTNDEAHESADGVHHVGWTTADWDEFCTIEEKMRWMREEPESQRNATRYTEKVYVHS